MKAERRDAQEWSEMQRSKHLLLFSCSDEMTCCLSDLQ